jgi:hypothetical protein
MMTTGKYATYIEISNLVFMSSAVNAEKATNKIISSVIRRNIIVKLYNLVYPSLHVECLLSLIVVLAF